MPQKQHDPLRNSGPGLDIIAGSDRGQLPHPTTQTQARLRVRAIVAARRIEDHRLDAEDRRREFDDTLADLRAIAAEGNRTAELLDEVGGVVEDLLATTLALLPRPHREPLTRAARRASETVGTLVDNLNRLAKLLGDATEHLDEGGAP